MFNANLTLQAPDFRRDARCNRFDWGAFAVAPIAQAGGGGCTLVRQPGDPSEKILRCGDSLTVQPAHGTHYRPITKAGRPLPAAIRLDDGALLIEFHPSPQQEDFQILTPLAVAAVRGTKWAMEVKSGANLDAGPCRRSGGDQPSPEPVCHS